VFQYVNSAYERLTGFTLEEVVGKDFRELRSDRIKSDVQDSINGSMKKGKVRLEYIIQYCNIFSV